MRLLALVVLTLALHGCGPGPTSADSARLEVVTKEWAGRLKIAPEQDLYLRAVALTAPDPTPEEAAGVFKSFWFSGSALRADTNYVYLNVYSQNGRFLFQMYHDPATRTLQIGRQEYY